MATEMKELKKIQIFKISKPFKKPKWKVIKFDRMEINSFLCKKIYFFKNKYYESTKN